MPRTITVTFEDGTTHVYMAAPDDVTPAQVSERASREFGKPVASLDGGKTGGIKQAVGDSVAGLVRGAGSIGATLLAPIDAAARALGVQKSLIGRTDRREAMTGALQDMGADPDSLAFQGGKVLAEVGGTMGVGGAAANLLGRSQAIAGAVPNVLNAIRTAGMSGGNPLVRAAGGAITGGASAGLVNPEDAGLGAAIGGAMPGAMQIAGKVGRSVGGAFRSNINNPALAQKAVTQYGIPLGPADISASRMTRATRSVLNDAPFTGGIGERQGAEVQKAFNRAVGATFGAADDSLTPQVLDAAKRRMGAEFDRIWSSNALQVDGQLVQKLSDLQNLAAKLPRNEGGSLNAEINDLLGKVTTDSAGNPVISGDVANKFQSYLRRRAEGSAGLRNELNDLRQSIISAFNRSVSPADAAALTSNRGQYKAFKTVEPLLAGAEAGVAGRQVGDVPAALLPQAVRKSYGANISGSPLGDLSQIGSQYVADRVQRTGGSARALVQNSAIGSALGLGALTNPLAAAAVIPAAMGAQKAMGSPELAKRMLMAAQSNPNALQRLLMSPDVQQAILRAAPAIAADQ